MSSIVDVERGLTLDDYAAVAHLAPAVSALRETAAAIAPRLAGRTVWMVNSTATGGGVAEMLPTTVALLRELGVATQWAVIESGDDQFFALTKRIHNMIHGTAGAPFGDADRARYDAVSRANADALLEQVAARDILVVHDPQPLGAGTLVRQERDVRAVWRCHIGLDERLPATDAAWAFLEPYAAVYDDAVFSSDAYVPPFLADRAVIVRPSIDPLDHKNRELDLQKLVGVLCSGALVVPHWPAVAPPFADLVQRLQSDGSWAPATVPEDIGLLGRPIVTQVSRWDRLKGFAPLLEGFRRLKQTRRGAARDERRRLLLEHVRLVLAGPAPESIQDDPEGLDVLDELRAHYLALEPAVQRDVALVTLPMSSRKENALLVNALHRASTIVVQNSLREGFGLTVTEAMWKGVAVLANSRAHGLREQIRDGVDGRLIADPEDADAIAGALDEMLGDAGARERYGQNGRRRVGDEFLIFTQLRQWLELFAR